MSIVTAPSQEKKVRFNNGKNEFFTELRSRVDAYFAQKGAAKTANAEMVMKTIILLGAFVGNYLLILLSGWNLWVILGLAAFQGFLLAGIGFSVAHDAIHGSYSNNTRVNTWLSYTMNLIGGSQYVWSLSHNIVHHTWTNIHEMDGDLEVAPFIRLSPHQPLKKVHRYQQWFALPVYALASFFWVFVKDYKKMAAKSIGPIARKHPAREWVILFFTKSLYYTYSIVLPLVFLDITWWQFVIGYMTFHFMAGITLGIVFQLAHVVEETEFPMPDDQGSMENAWAVHQMVTTNNFARRNRFLNWYIGGLNYQIEHHLFPKICSVHYPAISHITKATAEEYDIPYNEHPSFAAAVSSHFRALRMLGRVEYKPVEAAPTLQVA
ncbi:MAG: acyl-CoA desaturase [Bacteroidetes bacterium]|nr:acyl-CoA desaturase [Bacteroidota bacterium]